jgi:hypothetical protein
MSDSFPIRSLSSTGIARFADFISATRETEKSGALPLPLPADLLTDPANLHPPSIVGVIDPSRKFEDRLALGLYLVEQLGTNFLTTHQRSAGVWAWFALVWFDQLRARKTQRHEHFIPAEGLKNPLETLGTTQPLGYRQAVRSAFRIASRFGERGRLLVSKEGISAFGDASEQFLSRQWLKSSPKLAEFVWDLYRDRDGHMRKKALDKVPPPSRANGSRQGYGGVRRLIEDVLPRVKLTHDIDVMTTKQIVKVCGKEFALRGR